jgi:hypothetical protein
MSATNSQNKLWLANKVFYGHMGIKGFDNNQKGKLIFKNGMFTSIHCERWGFKPAKYESIKKDGKIFFKTILKSKENDTLVWEGTIEDKKINAKFFWIRKFLFWKIKKEYWFSGSEIKSK